MYLSFHALLLYDYCNAFPTLVHQWLFLVLKYLRLPRWLWLGIYWMYKDVGAYSSGIGNNAYLFDVLCGVKTGDPLSSLLFLLAINPFLDLFERHCDVPGNR